MAKSPVKKTRTSKSKKKDSTFRSIVRTLTSSKPLLFIVSFAVVGASYIAYSSAATLPEFHLNFPGKSGCQVIVKSRSFQVYATVKGSFISSPLNNKYMGYSTTLTVKVKNPDGKARKGTIYLYMKDTKGKVHYNYNVPVNMKAGQCRT